MIVQLNSTVMRNIWIALRGGIRIVADVVIINEMIEIVIAQVITTLQLTSEVKIKMMSFAVKCVDMTMALMKAMMQMMSFDLIVGSRSANSDSGNYYQTEKASFH
ncbi:MAG: hypothetical protein EZS28_003731 [Streblomastix strix]|uniref:Uncharacterized protein n=1 Tax=Streblomastix strix TaxID=222440 RepID=A0A5J4X2R6_9EUKA|nr:MAG: hypothetical protein EZS28_003731 [Streblomastix strix]